MKITWIASKERQTTNFFYLLGRDACEFYGQRFLVEIQYCRQKLRKTRRRGHEKGAFKRGNVIVTKKRSNLKQIMFV